MTADLLKRLESGSGADRELDALIEAEARRQEAYRAGIGDEHRAKWKPVGKTGDVEDGSTRYASMPVTSSLDAALSLVERMLPGWRVVNLCEWDHDVLRARGPWTCDLKRAGTQDDLTTRAAKCPHAQSPSRALLIALLRALEDQKQ